jgi:hypothetical protein
LLQRGLLKARLVPPEMIREPHDRTRQRTQMIHERSAIANPIQGVLDGANSELAGVAAHVPRGSGRDLPEALAAE